MAGKQVQRRRGTTAQHNTFIGASGEVTVDTNKHVMVVHDGATPGGFPLASVRDVESTNAVLAGVSNTANTALSTANTAITTANTAKAASDANTANMANKADLRTTNEFIGDTLRFRANMSAGGGTLASRYIFQTSWLNQPTNFTVMPNGSALRSALALFGTTNLENSQVCELACSTAAVSLSSGAYGSAGFVPLCFITSNSTRLQVNPNGSVQVANDLGGAFGYFSIGSADMATYTRTMRVQNTNALELLNHAGSLVTHSFGDGGVMTISGQLNAPSASITGPVALGSTLNVTGIITGSSLIQATGDVFTASYLRASTATNGGEAQVYRVRDGSQATAILRESEVGTAVGVTYLIASGMRSFAPLTDGALGSGWALARWSTVFAVTGAINTSDQREKTAVRAFSPEEMKVAQALAGDIGMYQWLSAIEEKGEDGARLHVGVTAQQVQARFEEQGLDATVYGLFCFDEWEAMPETLGAEGEVVSEAREAGNRYGIRYEELNTFIMRGLLENQRSIEARLAALEAV